MSVALAIQRRARQGAYKYVGRSPNPQRSRPMAARTTIRCRTRDSPHPSSHLKDLNAFDELVVPFIMHTGTAA
jgi:hypothetical protein